MCAYENEFITFVYDDNYYSLSEGVFLFSIDVVVTARNSTDLTSVKVIAGPAFYPKSVAITAM